MIDKNKRLARLTLADNHVVLAAEEAANSVVLEYKIPESLLTSVIAVCNNRAVLVDMILHPVGQPFNKAITLMQQEMTRGAGLDIIYEGEQYVPPFWQLTVSFNDALTGDVLGVHGGYDLCPS